MYLVANSVTSAKITGDVIVILNYLYNNKRVFPSVILFSYLLLLTYVIFEKMRKVAIS